VGQRRPGLRAAFDKCYINVHLRYLRTLGRSRHSTPKEVSVSAVLDNLYYEHGIPYSCNLALGAVKLEYFRQQLPSGLILLRQPDELTV
jgi:hypothetical protein